MKNSQQLSQITIDQLLYACEIRCENELLTNGEIQN